MANRLSAEDYRLLQDLKTEGGIARISGGRSRHGAERLVDLGFAVSRALNSSDVEYEMTPLGRQALTLRDYGFSNPAIDTIEPHKFDDGLWYIKVNCQGDPAVMMSIGAASKLMAALRAVQADELASQIEKQIERARRFVAAAI